MGVRRCPFNARTNLLVCLLPLPPYPLLLSMSANPKLERQRSAALTQTAFQRPRSTAQWRPPPKAVPPRPWRGSNGSSVLESIRTIDSPSVTVWAN
jgi:hypothetical protein